MKNTELLAELNRLRAEQGVHVPIPRPPKLLRPDDASIARALKRVANAEAYLARMKLQAAKSPDDPCMKDYVAFALSRRRKQLRILEDLRSMVIEIAKERAPKKPRIKGSQKEHDRLLKREQRWLARQAARVAAGEITPETYNEAYAVSMELLAASLQRIIK